MEKLLIIAEKPSACRNFAKALGGMSGEFEGDEYALVNLRGHLLRHETPEKVAFPNHKETVGGFANTENLPWSVDYFDWNKKVIGGKDAEAVRQAGDIISNIKRYLDAGYIPVIASDIDALGEGDLLVQEILIYLDYSGKIYREYHTDETPKPFLKALRERKDVTNKNPGFIASQTRSTLDFLTQQIVRVATMTLRNQGYRVKKVPVGRLQSTIMNMVGHQLDLVAAYKPSSNFESRYKVDNLVLSNSDMLKYPTKEAWTGDNLPETASVKEIKQVPGRTVPPKALPLTKLAGMLAKKGLSSKQTMSLAQKLYDDGVLSYPRTEDNFITPEQFIEMAPLVDPILELLGMSPAVFTHREPRPTHVKTGGSHGALRPGVNLPNNIDGLDTKYGNGAGKVFRIVAEHFVMMYLEDTEWVRHEYVTETNPVFKGSVRIVTKKGVTDPDEDTKDVATALPDISKHATLYAHEVKSVKPKAPTESWLLDKLEKDNVGTPATQVPTVGRMIGTDDKPLRYGKKQSDPLVLSPVGQVGYEVAKVISLGTAECTRRFENMIKDVVNEKRTAAEIYDEFTQTLNDDINTLRTMTLNLDKLGIPKATPRAEGTWNGKTVSIAKSCLGYTFTDDELQRLFNGETVSFEGVDFNNQPVSKSVKLYDTTYKGKPVVGFMDTEYCYGKWNGADIRFKRSFMGHTYTDDECQTLLDGGEISFTGTTKDDKPMSVHGKLAKLKMGQNSYVGLDAKFPPREGFVTGVWKGKEVSFKGEFMQHKFTPDEIEHLLAGDTIIIDGTSKAGNSEKVPGKLDKGSYKGHATFGFVPDFGKKKKQKL